MFKSVSSGVLSTLIASAIIVGVAAYFSGSTATVPVSISYSGWSCSMPSGQNSCQPTEDHYGKFSGTKFNGEWLHVDGESANGLASPVFRRLEIGLRESARNLSLRMSCEMVELGGVKNPISSELITFCPVDESINPPPGGDARLREIEYAVRDFTLNLLGADANNYHIKYDCVLNDDTEVYSGQDGEYCVGKSENNKQEASKKSPLKKIRIKVTPISWWERITGGAS